MLEHKIPTRRMLHMPQRIPPLEWGMQDPQARGKS
jgi:hypothetical protein